MLNFDQVNKTTTITCNICPQTFVRNEAPFDIPATAKSAKLARWSIERHAGGWQHYCPGCAQSRMRGKLL
jgi:hypothetical protein